jgi:hypothetical protein
VGSRAGLDTVVKSKISSLTRTRTPVIQLAAQRHTTELSRLLNINICTNENLPHVKKGKVKSLHLSKHPLYEDIWGVEVQIHAFLNSAVGGGEWS